MIMGTRCHDATGMIMTSNPSRGTLTRTAAAARRVPARLIPALVRVSGLAPGSIQIQVTARVNSG